MDKIEIKFEHRFWTSKENLPNYKGIYFVYRASNVHPNSKGGVSATLEELIYIGKAEEQTIKERHKDHEKQPQFDVALLDGEVLWYLTARVNKDIIDRVENGLIFKRQPRINDKLTESFKHPNTHFVLISDMIIPDMFANFYLKKYDK